MRKENLKNKKFHKLLVINEAADQITPKGKKVTRWECLCECGNKTIASSNNLKRGHVKSCGCLSKRGNHIKHNCSDKRLYHIWTNMLQRCSNPKNPDYKNYGGRNIKVCDEWKENFSNFYIWAMNNGYEENLTIERENVNGNYEACNCSWIPKEKQAQNKRNNNNIEIEGEKHCITEWARLLKIPLSTLRRKKLDDWQEIYREWRV